MPGKSLADPPAQQQLTGSQFHSSTVAQTRNFRLTIDVRELFAAARMPLGTASAFVSLQLPASLSGAEVSEHRVPGQYPENCQCCSQQQCLVRGGLQIGSGYSVGCVFQSRSISHYRCPAFFHLHSQRSAILLVQSQKISTPLKRKAVLLLWYFRPTQRILQY